MRYSISRWANIPTLGGVAREMRAACEPEDGHYITHEMVTIHWMKESNENGDIIYRRMTSDEVTAMESNNEVKEES
jgi:hypothetical protein